MKRCRFAILLCVIVFPILLLGCKEESALEDSDRYCGNFSLSKYSYAIENCATSIEVEPITNYQEAAACAKDVWMQTFDCECMKRPQERIVFYDDATQTWFVSGIRLYEKWEEPMDDGGMPRILIDGKENRVIAVWHTRK